MHLNHCSDHFVLGGPTPEAHTWLIASVSYASPFATARQLSVKGRPGMLQSMGSQRVRHDWVAEQQQRRLGLSQVLGVGDHMFLASSGYRSRMLLILLLHRITHTPAPLTNVNSTKVEKTCISSIQASALCLPHSSQG